MQGDPCHDEGERRADHSADQDQEQFIAVALPERFLRPRCQADRTHRLGPLDYCREEKREGEKRGKVQNDRCAVPLRMEGVFEERRRHSSRSEDSQRRIQKYDVGFPPTREKEIFDSEKEILGGVGVLRTEQRASVEVGDRSALDPELDARYKADELKHAWISIRLRHFFKRVVGVFLIRDRDDLAVFFEDADEFGEIVPEQSKGRKVEQLGPIGWFHGLEAL